jgi:hypothetical protein
MDYICSGIATAENQVGEYGNGNVYAGTGMRKHLIGKYSGGVIFYHNDFGSDLPAGHYSSGMAFMDANPAKAVGSCQEGIVYKGISKVGSYTGDEDGAAVAALLLGMFRD